jgi:hypothetical protein
MSENLLGAGSGSGRFRKLDPDPVKIRPDPQHCRKREDATQIRGGKVNLGSMISMVRIRHSLSCSLRREKLLSPIFFSERK